MKITILDNATLGADISTEQIKVFGKIEYFDVTKPEETKGRIANSEIVITNKVVIGENELNAAKSLKLICVAATGTNNIDFEAAAKHHVAVTNVKGYSTESVAQTVISYMLIFSSSTRKFSDFSLSGKWQKSPIFTNLDFPFFELKGKTLGIIGYGSIAKRVEELAQAFGMKILIAESLQKKEKLQNRTALPELLKSSDFVSVHTPLTPKTKNLISREELQMMKPTAFIINTARGGIINESDLRKALDNKSIAGAGVDVLSEEPPQNGNPLLVARNIILTPHIAWTSGESRARLIQGITNNIQTYVDGNIASIDLCKK